jgi:hypothetical protein
MPGKQKSTAKSCLQIKTVRIKIALTISSRGVRTMNKMPSFLIIAMLVFVAIAAQAQTYVDVVYLKNGSIIRGIIIEQTPNVSLKIKTGDGNIFVYKMEEVEKLAKEEAKTEAQPARADEKPRPLGPMALVFNPLGLLQVGPIVDLEFRTLPDVVLFGHFRYHGAGVLSHVIQSAFGSELEMTSAAVGAGMRYLVPLASMPHRPYIGFTGEYCWANYRDEVGRQTLELKGTNTLLVFMLNGGFRWRFEGGFLMCLGAYAGVATTLSDKWYRVNYTSVTGTGTKVTVFMGMLEFAIGTEF